MHTVLTCPVCHAPLVRGEKAFSCEARHSFDIAKQGYVNLLLAGGKHGDNALMINARRRFLSQGYYENLAMALREAVKSHVKEDAVFLDIGCGEGYYTTFIRQALGKGAGLYAFDISKDALKYAAKRDGHAVFFAASAYDIPIASDSVDAISLFFSPYAESEIKRTLRTGGIFIMAIPDERHLFGLKQVIYETPYLNRPEKTEIEGFRLLSDIPLRKEIVLTDKEDIAALFSMTPYYYKTAEKDKEKLYALSYLATETDFRLLVYQKL